MFIHFLQEFFGFFGSADDAGTKEDHQFDFLGGFVLFLEGPAEARDVAEEGGLTQGVGHLALDDAAQDEGLAALGFEIGFEVAGINDGAVKNGLAVDRGRFGVDL